MTSPRDVLTPAALSLVQIIAETGSFAAAARKVNMVPSALTYRVRQMEDVLDVLLFDRSSRQAKLTPAGEELLREGRALLAEVDAVANRVKRVATGWEPQLTIAVDSIINRTTIMELCERFFRMNPPTRLKLLSEVLSGTMAALSSGRADLAVGVVMDDHTRSGLQREPLGSMNFYFTVAPHHPLAKVAEPLTDHEIRKYRAIAIADSNQDGASLTVNLLTGQDVFTVADIQSKVEALIRAMGVGFLPGCVAQPYIDAGILIAKDIVRTESQAQVSYAWRNAQRAGAGKALLWWLEQLEQPATRAALLGARGVMR